VVESSHPCNRREYVFPGHLYCSLTFILLVSMINGILFDKLEALSSIIRGNTLPFGGLQVGDLTSISVTNCLSN
jgi:hypothetical protein